MDEDIIIIDGPIATRDSTFDDWFVIERAEHDGREWMEDLGNGGHALRTSARISDADVEGSREQILDLARAVISDRDTAHKRCAVACHSDGSFAFWSPRNSQAEARVAGDHARAWARDTIAALTPETGLKKLEKIVDGVDDDH